MMLIMLPPTLIFGIAAGVLGIVFAGARYWTASNSRDLGSMSEKWVAENNASNH